MQHLYLMGVTAPRSIAEAVRREARRTGLPGPAIHRVQDLEEAVALARRFARPGERVLLSPACASFDQFANFEERGDRFRELVAQLGSRGPAAAGGEEVHPLWNHPTDPTKQTPVPGARRPPPAPPRPGPTAGLITSCGPSA